MVVRTHFAVAPKQWEGRVFDFLGTSEADITEFRIGKESYDAVNLRRRYIEEQMEGSERDYYDYLFLHDKAGPSYHFGCLSCHPFCREKVTSLICGQ